jgi:signal transduction histidine kinase
MIVDNAMQNKDFPSDPQLQRFNIETAICVPLKANDTVSGVIYADSTQQCKWSQEHLQVLSLTGSLVGLTIDNCSMHSETKENYRLMQAGKATLNLSHSVKNILQMIGGAAEVIDFGLKSNQIHRVMKSWDILKPNLERLRKFTLDMLDYSKERKLELAKCDFNRVIQGSIESLQSQLKQKKSKLGIRIDQNIPGIELDSERIHEMSLNLILNAIDIVENTGGIVSVETKYLEQEQCILLSVTDNGPGMTDEMKEKIFTPFESDKNKMGTGLGMPIAKQIIDQHNGKIEIETTQGKGTTFNVILPAKIV